MKNVLPVNKGQNTCFPVSMAAWLNRKISHKSDFSYQWLTSQTIVMRIGKNNMLLLMKIFYNLADYLKQNKHYTMK